MCIIRNISKHSGVGSQVISKSSYINVCNLIISENLSGGSMKVNFKVCIT